MLERVHHNNLPMYLARSPAAKAGDFRIFYDDTMYWDNFSGLSPTQDIDAIKKAAQSIHDKYMSTSNI